jgi:hypothetical protein
LQLFVAKGKPDVFQVGPCYNQHAPHDPYVIQLRSILRTDRPNYTDCTYTIAAMVRKYLTDIDFINAFILFCAVRSIGPIQKSVG